MIKELSLDTTYFTKEFPPDWEIEWKGNLSTLDPAGFIYRAYGFVTEGCLNPFMLPKSLGRLPLGLSYLGINFHYYGHEDEHGWIEDFVLAQPPGLPFFISRIKTNVSVPGLNPEGVGVVIRQERKEDLRGAFPASHLQRFIRDFEVNQRVRTQFVGTLYRERYSFYLHNQTSFRNWSLLADRCQPIEPHKTVQFGQVEFEYKGIDGISSRNVFTQQAVLDEAVLLSNILIKHFGVDIIQPTSITKFKWLLQQKKE